VYIRHLHTTVTHLERSSAYTLGIYRHSGHQQTTVKHPERSSGCTLGIYTHTHTGHLQTTDNTLLRGHQDIHWASTHTHWSSTNNRQHTLERPSGFTMGICRQQSQSLERPLRFLFGISGHNSCMLLRGLVWRCTTFSLSQDSLI